MGNKTVTVKSSGGDYSSLNAALAGESANLVTGTCILTIECYAMEDTTATNTGTGYTTNTSYYINITVPIGERHSGVWSTSKYRLTVNAITILTNAVAYTKIDGLQVEGTLDSYGGSYITSTGASTIIKKNIVRITRAYGSHTGIYASSASNKVFNNIVYGFQIDGIITSASYLQTHYVYNNTIISRANGIQNAGNYLTAINNLVSGSGDTNAYVGTFTNSDYNATDGTDTGDGGAHSRRSQTFTFVDAANGDYHLASNDAGARTYGVSDPGSGLFSDDIDGVTRSAPWDIGADQYVAASGLSIPVAMANYRRLRA